MSEGAAEPAVRTEGARTAYPDGLRERERRWIERRRAAAGLGPERPWLGFGLSGGGIRSATFCLGFFQALADLGLLRRIDVLSSVSGGGYFGSFLGALFTRPRAGGSDGIDIEKIDIGEVERRLSARNPGREVGNLRENGRYLAPAGSGDLLLGGAALLRNWVAVQIVLAAFFTSLALLAQLPPALLAGALEGLAEPLHADAFWWTPWVLVPAAALLFLAVPPGWAYWLVGHHGRFTAARAALPLHPVFGVALVMGIAGWLLFAGAGGRLGALELPVLGAGILAVAALTLLAWGRARWRGRGVHGQAREALQRNALSHSLKAGLFWTGIAFAFAAVDALGLNLYRLWWWEAGVAWLRGCLATLAAALAAAAGFARRAAVLLTGPDGDRRPRLSVDLLATLAALLLTVLVLTAAAALAHGLAWGFTEPDTARLAPAPFPYVTLAFALAFSLAFGHAYAFLNRSSHQPLYSARLARAYLGASNPERKPGMPLSRFLVGDEVSLPAYFSARSAEKGAPVHCINVTVNETVDGRSQVQQQDRKGCPMALGPAGISVGVRHHLEMEWEHTRRDVEREPEGGRQTETRVVAAWPGPEAPYRVFLAPPGEFRGERLSLGRWIAISGAAFSTGTGYRTSLGLCLLAGFGNVRLGHWWDPGQRGRSGASLLERLFFNVFPVQAYLLSEFFARFPGTARHRWHLSDGGHFENLGGYELVRRRLPVIVLLDAEADAASTFGGLAGLVRKARVDFGAEIRFLESEELAQRVDPVHLPLFGSLADLRRGTGGPGLSAACAALGEVTYDDEPDAPPRTLLYVKPALLGGEPADLLEYLAKHPSFPHESTADQFFDEAQWESYRRLGEWIGAKLFASRGMGDGRAPRDLLG